MDIMFDYIKDPIKYMEVIEAVVDNKLMKLDVEYEKLMLEHEENLKSIELKILMESGTDEDLSYLYMMEAEEVNQKKQGIISKIISTVKDFINRVKQFLFGKKNKQENLPDTVNIPYKADDIEKESKMLIGDVSSFLSGNKKNLAKVGAGIAAVSGAYAIGKASIPSVKDALNKVLSDLGVATEKIEKAPEEKKNSNEAKGLLAKIKGLTSKTLKVGKAIDGSERKEYNDDEDDISTTKLTKDQKKNQKNNEKIIDSEERDDEIISKSKSAAQDNDNQISELKKNVQLMKDRKSQLEERLGSIDKNRGQNLFKKYKNNKEQEEYQRLKSIPERKLSTSELERKRDLAEKYEYGNQMKVHNRNKLETLISDLDEAIRKNESDIRTLTRKNINLSSNEIDAKVRKDVRSSKYNTKDSDLIARADSILKQ